LAEGGGKTKGVKKLKKGWWELCGKTK
jgi:hypothetical protein